MTPKSILWRGALTALMMALMTAMLTLGASAQPGGDSECKPLLNAAGKAKFRPFTQGRETRGEGAAMADAIANWQRDVSAKYGSQWMLWSRAQDKNWNCSPARPGTIGSWFIRCTIEARPCGGGPNTAEEPADPTDGRACSDYPRARVLEAQQRMNGCDACGRRISVDGECGPQTERCLRQFQSSRFGRSKDLEVTGAPNRSTMIALREFCER